MICMVEKTEKQKMLAGELYLATDPELAADSKHARRLLRMYNGTTEEEQKSDRTSSKNYLLR